MKLFPSLLSLLLLFLVVSPCEARNKVYGAVEGKLVALDGRVLDTLMDPTRVKNARFYAIYFAAENDEASQAFTPTLVQFYQYASQRFPKFDMILMSRDASDADMEEFMLSGPMLWPAVEYSAAKTNPLNRLASGAQIPVLVFLTAEGKVLASSTKQSLEQVLSFMDNYLKRNGR